jgi:hypothetical protein
MKDAMPDTTAAPRKTRLIDIETAIERLGPAFADVAARKADSLVETNYRFAGHTARVRIAGPGLAADVDKSLCYVRAEAEATPELTIDVWDDAEVGPLGLLPWPEDADYHGLISVTEDARYVLNQRPSSVLLLDRDENHIVGCVRGRNALFQDERARPFHRLVSIWLDDLGIQIIHAGLVAQDGKGLLFAGKSGAGKTTSTIACFLGGLTYLSDDCVALESKAEGGLVAHTFYATFMHDSMELFPSLVPIAHPPNHSFEAKDTVFLQDHETERFGHQVDIAAVVVPKLFDRADTTYRRASTMDAMLALAPSSLWILPASAKHALAKLDEVVTTVPAYWLELGRDIDQTAETVKRLCAELGNGG